MSITENNCNITNLRGSKLGVIRLSNLAYPREKDFKIKIGDLEVIPVGFDTYGHPVISEEQFEIYQNMKASKERENKILAVEVSYAKMPFVIRSELFDTVEGIETAIRTSIAEKNLQAFKEMLIRRKQYAFTGKLLNDFVIFERYFLAKNGRVYNVKNVHYKEIAMGAEMNERPDLRDTVAMEELAGIEIVSEVHLPNVGEKCAICGKEFTLNDIANGIFEENDSAEKGHIECFAYYNDAINWQKANTIIDAVYDKPETEEISDIVDEDGGFKEVKRYLYHTEDGDVSIRFKTKVIEIKWHGKFKPFDFEKIFESETSTKEIKEDGTKIIHAWSKDKAIGYLLQAKFAN